MMGIIAACGRRVLQTIDPVDVDDFSGSGSEGYFEVDIDFGTYIGYVGIEANSSSIPDRFQLEWNGNIVAESLFVGDALNNWTPSATTEDHNLIRNATTLNKYVWSTTNNGFVDSGSDISVDFDSTDIADGNATRPNTFDGSVGGQIGVYGGYPFSGAKASDGNVLLLFNKNLASPSRVKLRVWGVDASTYWSVQSIVYNVESSVSIETLTGTSTGGGYTLFGDLNFSVPTVTEKGIVYKTTDSSNVTIGASGVTKVAHGNTDIGQYSVTAFEFGTVYFRAYVIAGGVTYYADDILEVSGSGSTPVVRTNGVVYDSINENINAEADIISDGGNTITERGFVYSNVNSTPTTSDVKQVVSGTNTLYSAEIPVIPQASNVTFYVRAYVITSLGTTYGKIKEVIVTPN